MQKSTRGRLRRPWFADPTRSAMPKFQTETLPRVHSLSTPSARDAHSVVAWDIPGLPTGLSQRDTDECTGFSTELSSYHQPLFHSLSTGLSTGCTRHCEERLVRRSSTSEVGSDEAIHWHCCSGCDGACHRARIRADPLASCLLPRARCHLSPLWERSDRIARCDPGEGFRSLDRP